MKKKPLDPLPGTVGVMAQHLACLLDTDWNRCLHASAKIYENPQAHIDALVEAGVLERHDAKTWTGEPHYTWYQVVQPHVHEWRVYPQPPVPNRGPDVDEDAHVAIHCKGCQSYRFASNRLPIEIPQDTPNA